MTETIKLTNLTRTFQRGDMAVQALKGVDLSIDSGEFVALIGPSGSGKSTLMNLLGALDKPTSGELWLDGLPLHDSSEQAQTYHRKERVGFIFQSFNLLPRLTAQENVAVPLMLAGVPKAERDARAAEMLEMVGLDHRLTHYPTELSGGEQQRTAVARALIHKPALILADEPTGNLDSKTGETIMGLLQALNREQGITLVVVTHNDEVASYADRIVKLRDGEIVAIEQRRAAFATTAITSYEKSRASVGEAQLLATQPQLSAQKAMLPVSNTNGRSTPINQHTNQPLATTEMRGVLHRDGDPQASIENRKSKIEPASAGKFLFSDILRFATSNLGRRVVRNVLTAGGVLIGIVTLVAMVSMGVGVQQEVRRNFETIGLENVFVNPVFDEQQDEFDPFAEPEPKQPITPAIVAEIAALPGVRSVEPALGLPRGMETAVSINGETQSVRISDGFGEGRFGFGNTNTPAAGVLLSPETESGVVLVNALADDLLAEGENYDDLIGQEIVLTVQLPRGETADFTSSIIGVRNSFGGRTIDLAVSERAAIKAWWFNDPNILETQGFDALTVRAESIAAIPTISEPIEELQLETQSLEAILDAANQVLSLMQALLGSVGGLALLVAALGVANTMMMAIYERTREIGVLKALGASPREIRRLFTVEAGFIGLIGGIFGLIFGTLLGRLVDYIAHRYLLNEGITGVGQLSVVPLWLAVGALAFATLIGILAGLYPAARAAKLDPVTALRHE